MTDDEDGWGIPNGPWRDGALWVLTVKCDTCIFRPHNLMQLAPGRVKGMVDACLAEDTVIPCHETLDGPRSICRGFYDSYGDATATMQIAQRLGVLAFNDSPAGE